MKAHSAESQSTVTPSKALQFLREGNNRFVNNLKVNRNLLEQVNDTREGQWPFAIVLSCIDSRTSAELIFDQGLGDIFSVRIAGNILNQDILGSMEFATKVVGSRIIVVLGHSKCGAIKGACDHIEMGNLTTLLNKIQPAVNEEKTTLENRNSKNAEFVEKVASLNVKLTMDRVRKESEIIRELEESGAIKIVGGMYDVDSGKVDFYE
ncbi:MAG: carbonic anhydrase [Saprospiraceae bacterium]|jgi:carbonic anhydrase|nr:carbonic anhydrase [Saprospiraceae bacterium]MBK8668082.1 carbonic anhydrase [Saprospiraceae bacterium]